MPFMVRGNGVWQIGSCSDQSITYKLRSDARQAFRAARELAAETGIPIAEIIPRLKPWIDRDVVLTPELLGLGDPCARFYAEMFAGGPSEGE